MKNDNIDQSDNTDQNDNIDQGALRILDALSGADQDLLARCDEEGGPAIPLWRRGRMWAACLGLIAVGALAWNALRFAGPSEKSLFTQDDAMDKIAMQDAGDGGQLNGAPVAEVQEDAEAPAAGVSEEAPPEEHDGLTDAVKESDGQEACPPDGAEEATDLEACPPDGAREVTEQEAREWMPLGAFIPRNLPSGYVFESARIDEEEQDVTVCWSRGMDSIVITVSQVEADTVVLADISRPETYDERLYEIPFGETVPAEYLQTFQDPVFDWTDLGADTGLELMESRLLAYEDAGDTDTPRGNFSVLYPDGVLLRFNGRGTPEEIWNMFYSMMR